MSTPAIFLSYAREDAASVRRVAEALRAGGIEVWFDENELRGGDSWDVKIRKQIRECTLFLPMISAQTQARHEGYFRREWKLAVERMGDMAAGVAFLVPVVIDDTREADALVPEEFMRVQWTRLPGALPTPQFVEQVKHLLAAPRQPVTGRTLRTPPSTAQVGPMGVPSFADPALEKPRTAQSRWPLALAGVAVLAVIGAVFFFASKPTPEPVAAGASAPKSTAQTATPPAPSLGKSVASDQPVAGTDKSIAVLAFADLSEARNGEFFSDGVSEELLNVLAKVQGLRVAARTSAFFFKGKNLPIPEIAAKLNVAYIVEGSVQRAGDRVKITAQLIKAADGFHVWSDTFTRDAKDVFAVQEEIAGLITKQLSLKLGVSSVAATAAVNPEAFELFVQARLAWNQRNSEAFARAETMLRRALTLDPNFTRARALLALVWTFQALDRRELGLFGQRNAPVVVQIRAEIDRALALDPDLAEAHTALGYLHWLTWRTEDAVRALQLAVTLNPNYATAYQFLGRRLLSEGRLDEGEAMMRRATELDPLSHRILDNYYLPLSLQKRYAEALVVVDRALALQPDSLQARVWKTLCLSALGRHDEAVALLREIPQANDIYAPFVTTVLTAAGLHGEAEQVLTRIPRDDRSDNRFRVLARLGRMQEALDAMDPAQAAIANTGELLFSEIYDPIRAEPRFAQILATLGLTEAHARAQAWRAANPTPARPAKK
jgi:TolB-like protein/tetratricopeptide (TPR) repeat protein